MSETIKGILYGGVIFWGLWWFHKLIVRTLGAEALEGDPLVEIALMSPPGEEPPNHTPQEEIEFQKWDAQNHTGQ